MAIFGIGAYYDKDVSPQFIAANLIGVGWNKEEAPGLHDFVRTLKPGDVVYIKSVTPNSEHIVVKAIGLISDEDFLDEEVTEGLVHAGRRVVWLDTEEFRIEKPHEKNNVRQNTLYEEYHPLVRHAVLGRFISRLRPGN